MKTVINVKADQEVKIKAKKIAQDLGLSLSAVINAYLKQFIRNKSVYFSSTPNMSKELEDILGKIEGDIKRGKNLSRSISDSKNLKKYLSSLC
ncbi:MAG: type II toxin-antitoxin system antitoxin, RelB/DinJ family [Parcubacteria group bacterium]|jgi:addiction module RelB/DinJ family antitoxin|nr:type II toxin-antitoxin system antitoxin, RelB/DinJ family [Parcubacteria group bacterium]|tara:strand:+ start:454 stop:732 length:279 start_codon:yes stop_codon:yes gene_type:complete